MRRFIKRGCATMLKATFFFAICMLCMSVGGCEKHKHNLSHIEKVEATCMSEGQNEHWKCLGCAKIFSDSEAKNEISQQDITIAKTSHKSIEDASVLPTCENTGLRPGSHCAFCNQVIQKQEIIPQLGHTYDYENITWVWENFEKAVLRLTCMNDVNHIKEYVAEIRSETRDPTCLNPGETLYIASVIVNETTYIDFKKEVLLPVDHEFDLEHILWIWDEYSTVTAQIPCKLDSLHSLNISAEISKTTIDATCTEAGKKITTATIVIAGRTFTDCKEEEIPAFGHEYDYHELEWMWETYDSVKAIVKCTHDSLHQLEYTADITFLTTPATCTTEGKVNYTAKIIVGDQVYIDEKEEIIPSLGHNYSYHQPTWVWNGFDSAKVEFICHNDASHIEEYDASIEETILLATCVNQGNISHVARVKVDEFNYTYEKSLILPVDETNHEFDYEKIKWEWNPIVEGYQVKATIQCGCGAEIQTEEALVESVKTPATFEKTGCLQYTAYAFESYTNQKELILPIKEYVSTEEEFLKAIQKESYTLILMSDIVLTEGARLEGSYAEIDLNGYSITMPNYSLRIVATHAYIGNGYLVTDLENTVGSYVIGTDEKANVLIENLITMGGINIWNANAVVRDCDVTATFYYAVCSQGEAKVSIESGIYRKSFISGCANTFFWIEGAGIDEGIEFKASELFIEKGVELVTASNATLYNTSGTSPSFDETPVIHSIDPKEYLASPLEFKCLSLQQDILYTLEDKTPLFTGKKIVIDLEGHTFTAPEGTLYCNASLVRIRNGYITLDSDASDYAFIFENGVCALLDNLVITGGIKASNASVTMKNVTLNATNSYAVYSCHQSEVYLLIDSTLNYGFQPKLTTTKVTKNLTGSHNAYYFVEEGSKVVVDDIVYESATGAFLYDLEGIPPNEKNST